MRSGDCLVHLHDCREVNRQEGEMHPGTAKGVNTRKPKMAADGGPIPPLPCSSSLLLIELCQGPHWGHPRINAEAHTLLTPPFPQMGSILMRSLDERSNPSDRKRDGEIEKAE